MTVMLAVLAGVSVALVGAAAGRAVWIYRLRPARDRRHRPILDEARLAAITADIEAQLRHDARPWLHTAAAATGADAWDVTATGFDRLTAHYLRLHLDAEDTRRWRVRRRHTSGGRL